MRKKRQPIDDQIGALVWMRRQRRNTAQEKQTAKCTKKRAALFVPVKYEGSQRIGQLYFRNGSIRADLETSAIHDGATKGRLISSFSM
jgi:hypothetical protein